MDHEQLLTFITISELNNYSRTALHLNVTQPAVTARIQKLEIELGCKLFCRDGKKIFLTEEGKALLPYARKVLDYINEAQETIVSMKKPSVKIGVSPAIATSIVLKVLSLLRAQNECSFDLVEAEDSVEISKMTEEGLIDIGLVRDVVSFQNLASKHLYHEKLIFIVSKNHPLAGKREIYKEDLMGQTMICYKRRTSIWQKIDEMLVGVKNLQRIEVGGFEMLRSMLKDNWGFSIIPELAIDNKMINADQDVCIIPLAEFQPLTFNMLGIYKQDSLKIEKLHLFLQFFENYFAELIND